MSLTAIVATHAAYAHYLPRCLDSCREFGIEEVLVYEDGSSDESREVLARYPEAIVTRRETATGGPVWGSNLGIADATSTHTMYLDSDNWLLRRPPTDDVDYTFAAVPLYDEDAPKMRRGRPYVWEYPDWPLTAEGCMEHFLANAREGRAVVPFPWGGVWRTDFIRPLRWRQWPSTMWAADFRTALDWCAAGPTLAYTPKPFLAFRTHTGQWSESPERALGQADALAFAHGVESAQEQQ